MTDKARRLAIEPRAAQFLAAGFVALVAVGLAIAGVWVFGSPRVAARGSVWRLVLTDRITLGFVRLAVIGLALYVLASVAALAVGGRWVRGFSSSGIQADDLKESSKEVSDLLVRLQVAEQRFDEASRLVWRLLRG